MKIIVQKFGGSSLGSIQRIRDAAAIVQKSVDEGFSVVVVASAMGNSTDDLLLLSSSFDAKKSKREMDLLLSTGEQVSTSLLAMALNSIDVPATAFTGWQAGILTDNQYGSAEIKCVDTYALMKCLKQKRVAVVCGYQGVSESCAITTLGRGGSDTTAVAIAAHLKAERCDIFTDVDGIYSCDPRMCDRSVKYEQVNYTEMLNFAKAGALVMAPSAMDIARDYNVELRVRSAYNPADQGTLIDGSSTGDFLGVACDSQQEIFAVHRADNLAELAIIQEFKNRAVELGMPLEVICRVGRKTAHKAYLAVSNRHVHDVIGLVNELAIELHLPMEHAKPLAKLSLVGDFYNAGDTLNKVFSSLIHHKIVPRFWNAEGQSRVSVWIKRDQLLPAADSLHHVFLKEKLQIPA